MFVKKKSSIKGIIVKRRRKEIEGLKVIIKSSNGEIKSHLDTGPIGVSV